MEIKKVHDCITQDSMLVHYFSGRVLQHKSMAHFYLVTQDYDVPDQCSHETNTPRKARKMMPPAFYWFYWLVEIKGQV